MMWLILMLILLFPFGWILFTPLELEVDTELANYQCYQRGTLRFWLASDFRPHLRVFGISVPLKGNKKTTELKTTKPNRKRSVSFRQWQALVARISRSIAITRFHLDLDTDDVVMNAQMVPVFFFLSRGPVQLNTNFEGRVYASVRAELKLYRIAWAFLLFFTKK
jgi:hypothetical protein